MKITELRFGVSRLEDGTRVLTPLGPVGGVYEFSDRVLRRYRSVMRGFIGAGMVIVTASAGFAGLGQITWSTWFEALTIASLIWVSAFELIVRVMFYRAPRAIVTPTVSLTRTMSGFIATGWVGIAITAYFVILGAPGLVIDLVSARNDYAILAPWIWLFVAGAYVFRRIRARTKR